jgi:hypothetical protein|tara:strand:- start:784 stop:1152 length:369 start_codon:yes stop_codon:yes gene_type:complete
MGILAKMFGAGDVIQSGMDLIDKLHTSDEEEIAAKSKAKTDLLSAYAPFKIAQRYLAVMFAFTFLASFFLTMTMVVFKYGSISDVKIVIDQFYIGEIMLTIIGFYFAGGAIEGVVSRVKQKS